jgi:hypothetical protein
MLIRFMKRSLLNQKKTMALMIASVAVGTTLAASLITISLEISGKVSKEELRAFGANIIVFPLKGYYPEYDAVEIIVENSRHKFLFYKCLSVFICGQMLFIG